MVSIPEYGTFSTRNWLARSGQNPRTEKNIDMAAAKMPFFKASKALRNAVC